MGTAIVLRLKLLKNRVNRKYGKNINFFETDFLH